MTIEKLTRVMWRLTKRNPNMKKIHWSELRKAIMHEIGTDIRTYIKNKQALVAIGWIRSCKSKVIITGKHLE